VRKRGSEEAREQGNEGARQRGRRARMNTPASVGS
jgi:hypothetical protein